MYLKTYLEFSSDPTMWLNDEIISFASCWLLRDQKLTSQFEFIPPIVTKCVCDFVAAINGKKVPKDPVTHLSSSICTIHSYLAHSPRLLQKKFIFFTINQEQQHWSGIVAVNPWKVILDSLDGETGRQWHLKES